MTSFDCPNPTYQSTIYFYFIHSHYPFILKKLLLLGLAAITLSAFTTLPGKLKSTISHIAFYSHTAFEDIKANNYKSIAVLNTESGDVIISVPMQSFEFEKRLMQKHFNQENYLNTADFPKAKFKGSIQNMDSHDFNKSGEIALIIKGNMTIKGKTQPTTMEATALVKKGKIHLSTAFNLTLSDYGVEFTSGKPSKHIAKTIEVNANFEFNE